METSEPATSDPETPDARSKTGLLDALSEVGVEHSPSTGEMLCTEGEQHDEANVVASSSFWSDEHATTTWSARWSTGSTPFGAGDWSTVDPSVEEHRIGAMLGFPRSATARATTDIVLTAMPPHEFRAQVEQA